MLFLDTTSKLVSVITSAAVSVDVVANWVDITASGGTPGMSITKISTATTTTIVAAPAASTQRQVKSLYITNRDATSPVTASVELFDGTNAARPYSRTLLAGETAIFDANGNWSAISADGVPITVAAS